MSFGSGDLGDGTLSLGETNQSECKNDPSARLQNRDGNRDLQVGVLDYVIDGEYVIVYHIDSVCPCESQMDFIVEQYEERYLVLTEVNSMETDSDCTCRMDLSVAIQGLDLDSGVVIDVYNEDHSRHYGTLDIGSQNDCNIECVVSEECWRLDLATPDCDGDFVCMDNICMFQCFDGDNLGETGDSGWYGEPDCGDSGDSGWYGEPDCGDSGDSGWYDDSGCGDSGDSGWYDDPDCGDSGDSGWYDDPDCGDSGDSGWYDDDPADCGDSGDSGWYDDPDCGDSGDSGWYGDDTGCGETGDGGWYNEGAECRSDADCSPGLFCMIDDPAMQGDCYLDDDGTEYCDGMRPDGEFFGICLPREDWDNGNDDYNEGAPCYSDEECGRGLFCMLDDPSLCEECFIDEAGNERCDCIGPDGTVGFGICLPRGNWDDGRDEYNEGAPCYSDEECGRGLFCMLDDPGLYEECFTDETGEVFCEVRPPDGEFLGICLPRDNWDDGNDDYNEGAPCFYDDECGPGLFCMPEDPAGFGVCMPEENRDEVRECLSDDECGRGYVCQFEFYDEDGNCYVDEATGTTYCRDWYPEGIGICVPGGNDYNEGDVCYSDSDCGEGLFCMPEGPEGFGICIPGDVVPADECPEGILYCDDSGCWCDRP
jgi:hypothetical protein